MAGNSKNSTASQPTGPEGVPLDAPDNTAPAISPLAVSRTHRAEDDPIAFVKSPEFSDEANLAIDDRVSGERWIPGVTETPKRAR